MNLECYRVSNLTDRLHPVQMSLGDLALVMQINAGLLKLAEAWGQCYMASVRLEVNWRTMRTPAMEVLASKVQALRNRVNREMGCWNQLSRQLYGICQSRWEQHRMVQQSQPRIANFIGDDLIAFD
ncbi:MAG: hypothetical protein M1816_006395 [Peltula sp. TS41687]|nr:MAG: hypothetical protein M1816_006395 [Peltula sp. TS41687]